MLIKILMVLLGLSILVPFGVFYISEKVKKQSEGRTGRFKQILAFNIFSFFGVLIVCTLVIFTGTAYAETETAAALSNQAGLAFIGAALSTGLGSLGAGIATGSAASAALGALSENDTIMGKALIFVALAEGIAIYGLIIAFMILNRV